MGTITVQKLANLLEDHTFAAAADRFLTGE